jgi:hypothetical protein
LAKRRTVFFGNVPPAAGATLHQAVRLPAANSVKEAMAADPPEADPSRIDWRDVEQGFAEVARLIERFAWQLTFEGATDAEMGHLNDVRQAAQRGASSAKLAQGSSRTTKRD